MEIEKFNEIFNDKTSLQIEAMRNNYEGKEIIIEGKISNINSRYVEVQYKEKEIISISFDEYFTKQLLDYARRTNVIIHAKVSRITFGYEKPLLDLNLISITKA